MGLGAGFKKGDPELRYDMIRYKRMESSPITARTLASQVFKSILAVSFSLKIRAIPISLGEDLPAHDVVHVALTEQSEAIASQSTQYERHSNSRKNDKTVSHSGTHEEKCLSSDTNDFLLHRGC